MTSDRTIQAITRQLSAMNCGSYELGLRDALSGRIIHRKAALKDVLNLVPWLKRMNAHGWDIYIRPAHEIPHGLILLDDLTSRALDTMNEDGNTPCVVVETSRENYQAWLKIPRETTPDCRAEIARSLAFRYKADPNSANSRHYGRLAGFTNRKSQYASRDGHYPWVLCRRSSGQEAILGSELVRHAVARMKEKKDARVLSDGLIERGQGQEAEQHKLNVSDEYNHEMCRSVKKYGGDLSRCDFIVALKLATRGHNAEAIARAMAAASPDLSIRKEGREDEYINRTIKKVMLYKKTHLPR